MAKRSVLTLVLVAVLAAMTGAVTLIIATREPAYENPVLANDAPDPSVIRASDGSFYAYTTQSYHGARFLNLPILRSTDLITWSLVGDAFPERPDWVVPGSDHGDVWAPHITEWNGTYHLFYSARSLELGNMAIGVATSQSPTGPFEDRGSPLVTGDRGYEAIDPFAWQTPDGTKYLYWGSDQAPIRAQELSPDGMDLVGEPVDLLSPLASQEYEGLIEGAWMMRNGQHYYLMYSGGACCGPEAHYAVLVARGSSPLGPFERYAANPILEANEEFNAPGHHATIRDDAGQDWIVYHAMDRDDITNVRFMFLDRIEWVDGWPVVNEGNGPSSEFDDAPVVEDTT